MSNEICQLTAIELLLAYELGELSPVAVTEAVLARIHDLQDAYNAFCLIDDDGAMDSARQSEKRWLVGEPEGRLDGVPATVKDLVLTKGWPTMRGSKTTDRDQSWNEDAPAVARLRENGAVLLGKTTTPEYGWKGVTDSPLTGITKNPWNIEFTPGGSSGGAAVA